MRRRRAAAAVAGSERAASAAAEDTRLRGRWLLAARAAWLSIAAVTLGIFVAGIPAEDADAQSMCPTASCASGQLGPAGLRALHALGLSLGFYVGYAIALQVVVAGVFCAVAAVIFWRRSDDRMALFASLTLLTFGAAGLTGTPIALANLFPALALLVASVRYLGSASFDLFLFLFPSGRFVPRWTRWVALAWITVQAGHDFFPRSPFASDTWPVILATAVWGSFFGCVIYSQIYRYRYVSTAAQRQQIRWVVLGITAGLVGDFTGLLVEHVFASKLTSSGALVAYLAGGTIVEIAVLLVPMSIGIAMLRSHLFDVDLLINRALVYGTLTACVVAVYVLLVGSLGALFQARGNLIVSLLATGVVAVLFEPLREGLQRGANRLLYGQRDEPYAVISQMSQRLEAVLAPGAVLPTVVETVAQALKLPYAALSLQEAGQLTVVASFGSPAGEPLRLPLVYHAETIGELSVSPRAPGDLWTPADRHLLDELARHAGVAAHAVRLTAHLQRSNADLIGARERLVTAREEERRRLRRDLHDGLGPALAALTLKVGAARKLLPRDQAAADALLVELGDDLQATVADIRRLVYNLRPPTLDELGLVGAIRERAAQYTMSNGGGKADGLRIDVSAPDHLPPLSAAVEVAAYRITQEALTNVARHAHAHTCQIHLTLDDSLGLEIADDGVGLPQERRTGVGLTAMRERAAELGGTCTVEPAPTGGTRVLALLPVLKKQ
jgi:signal transduction histidine kinase